MTVCWEVKAARNDPWLRRHGAPVEVWKLGPERGRYQHPELYGQPQETRMPDGALPAAATDRSSASMETPPEPTRTSSE